MSNPIRTPGRRSRVHRAGLLVALTVLLCAPRSAAQATDAPTPRALDAAVSVTALGPMPGQHLAELSLSDGTLLDIAGLPERAREALELTLDVDGAPITLVIAPTSVRAPGFQLTTQGAGGLIAPAPIPAPTTVRGHVRGFPDSLVAGSVRNGLLTLAWRLAPGQTLWSITPLSSGQHALYSEASLVDPGGVCGNITPHMTATPTLEPELAEAGGVTVEVAKIALEVDFEYFQIHGNTDDVVDDVESIIGMVEVIYTGFVGIGYEIVAINVQTDINDPYSATDSVGMVQEFQSVWNSPPFSGITRAVAHLFTDRGGGAVIGIASVGTMCQQTQAYGLSRSRFSNSTLQRVSLTAHELGHNWDAGHCDMTLDCFIMCSVIGQCGGVFDQFGSMSTSSIVSKRNGVGCLTTEVVPGFPHITSIFPVFSKSTGGGVLEIHGETFPTEFDPTVTIDGQEVEVLTRSETLVTVAVPPGTPGTTVDVVLTDGVTTTTLSGGLRYELGMIAGDKARSRIEVMETERFFFDGLEDMKLTVVMKPLDAEASLIAAFRLIGPGEQVLAAEQGFVTKIGSPVSLKKFVLPSTGEYRLEAFGVGVSQGAYEMKTKAVAPKSAKDTLGVSGTTPEPTLSFGAAAGTLLKLGLIKKQKAKGDFATIEGQPSDLTPTILGLTGPGGPVAIDDFLLLSPKGTNAKVKQVPLPDTGDYVLTFGGLDGTVGYGKVSAKLKALKRKPVLYLLEE